MTAGGNESPLFIDLDELARTAQKAAEAIDYRAQGLAVVGFFDLSGSTGAKLHYGNRVAVRDALAFTGLAASVCDRLDGRVVKTLGDGVLVTFDDAVAALRAAVNLRYAVHEHLGMDMTAGLTAGTPLRVALDGGSEDVLGDVVDRAARIQSLASPGQVLVDAALRDQVRADLAGQPGWVIDAQPRHAHAKGIGPVDLYEVSLKGHWNPKSQLATPFTVEATGRPTISEKIALIRNAKTEIVEIGIGLTSFAQYFKGQRPDEFADPIRELVRSGVNLTCFALDPDYEPGTAWLAEQDDDDYQQAATRARQLLLDEAKRCRQNNYLGRLTYHTYRRVPEFWCLGVDVDDPLDGRMFFQPYLMGVARSATPVVQVSRTSYPRLYKTYLQSVHAVRAASTDGNAT